MDTKILLTCTALFLTNHVSAQIAGIGGDPGPAQNAALFSNANQNPNATGSSTILGVDTSLDKFEIRPVVWDVSINVKEVPWTSNQTVSNSVISFSAAPEIFNTSDVWESCMLIFLDVERKATVKGQDDKGGCGATLGEDCVGNLTQALSTAMSQSEQRNATSPCNSMTLPRIPTQCQGSVSKDSLRSSMFPTHAPQLYTYRFAAISLNQTTGDSYFFNASDPHDASNTTFYESAATRIWPLVLIQSSVKDGGGGATSAKMSCLRASMLLLGQRQLVMFLGQETGFSMAFGCFWVLRLLALGCYDRYQFDFSVNLNCMKFH
jgi:hypothetical protein